MLVRHQGQGSSFKALCPRAGLGIHVSRTGLVHTVGLVEAVRRPPQAPRETEHKPAHLLLRAAWTGSVTIAEGDGVADHGDCHNNGPRGMTTAREAPPRPPPATVTPCWGLAHQTQIPSTLPSGSGPRRVVPPIHMLGSWAPAPSQARCRCAPRPAPPGGAHSTGRHTGGSCCDGGAARAPALRGTSGLSREVGDTSRGTVSS